MSLFDTTVPPNINDILVKVNEAIQKLIFLNDEIFSQSNQEAYELMLFLYKVFSDEKFYHANTSWSFLLKDDLIFSRFIISIWSQLSKRYRQFEYHSNWTMPKETPNNDSNERNVCIFHFINEVTFFLTKYQYEHEELLQFNESLVKNKLLKKLVRFFDDLNWTNSELIQIANTIRNISKNSFQMDRNIWTILDIESKLKSSVNMKEANFKTIVKSISLRINQKTVSESLEYFSSINDAQKIIETMQVYTDFYYLKKMLKKPNFKEFHYFSELKTLDLFCNILLKFYEIKDQLNFKSYVERKEDIDVDNDGIDLNERMISILDCLLFIINKCAFKSILLGLYFNQRKLIKILCDFVKSDEFINKAILSVKNTLFSNMTILVLYSEENKNDWIDVCPVSSLLDLLGKHSENPYISRQLNIMIGYLANDKQIEELKQIEAYSNVLLNHLKEIANKFELNETMKRIKCEYLTNTKKMVTHNTYSSFFNGMLTGTLNLLTRLAVNQKEKKKIFSSAMKSIETIIYMGNDLEKYFALKLVAQLNFDKDNSNQIAKNTKLVNYLTESSRYFSKPIAKNENNLDDEIRFICENIIWMIRQNENLTEEKDNKRNDREETISKHIMISYSWSVQKECLEIKKALEKLNHKVWMDVDQMSGSTMEAMSKAVDNSFCILICVCEKYKLSENCQLEAKYAAKRQKPFIPLVMQAGYGNVDGWLGFLISDKLFIDFTSKRNTFEKCINLLEAEIQKIIQIKNFKEIGANLHISDKNITKNDDPKSKISRDVEIIKSWNSEQLNKWLNDNKIHVEIINSFSKLDGACLEQFYLLSIENPQFVYQSLISEAHEKLKLADVLLFITRVKTLFQISK